MQSRLIELAKTTSDGFNEVKTDEIQNLNIDS